MVDVWTATLGAGLLLMVVSILGGGFQVKEIRVPRMRAVSRTLGFICGVCLFVLAVGHEHIIPRLEPSKPMPGFDSPRRGQVTPEPTPPLTPSVAPQPPGIMQWFVQLGSFAEGDGNARSSAETQIAAAAGCGDFKSLSIVDASKNFENLAPGYLVALLGPFDSQAAAEVVRNRVTPRCLRNTLVKMARRRV